MIKKISIIWLVFTASVWSVLAKERNTGIIPIPANIEWRHGTLNVPVNLTFSANFTGKYLSDIKEWMERMAGGISPFEFEQVKVGKRPLLMLNITKKGAAESYELTVTDRAIVVNAADMAGVFYALQSLCQMTKHFDMNLPALSIKDKPRFEYRGQMFDPARNFRSLDFIKRQLDMMAYYKLNRMHLHLTDDAGWRIEIKKYPQLTEQAAHYPYPNHEGWWRNGGRFCKSDNVQATGGFYTQEEIKDLIEYARKLNITIMPEIDLPSHSSAALSVFPQMTCAGVGGIYCAGNEQSFQFLEDVLTEITELFPSKYIHIGGDEVNKSVWAECDKCQKRMVTEQLKDLNELQSYMVKRIDGFLSSKGRNLVGWDEILHGGLASGATVMSWTGESGGIEAARQGKKAIITPERYCYIDGAQDDPRQGVMTSGFYIPLERVYSYDPAPESLGSDITKHILGVQTNLWSEWIDNEEQVELMLWPRAIATAEIGWSPNERKSYRQFRANVVEATQQMRKLGYTTFDLDNEQGERPEYFEVINSLATGKKVIYPNSNKELADYSVLTNGRQGSWNIGDHWLNLSPSNRKDFVVDLGEVKEIKSISICFLQAVIRTIILPTDVEFLVSDDNENFTSIRKIHNDIPNDFRQNVYKDFSWYGCLNTRYIRVKVTSDRWFAADEIKVW